MGLVLWIDHNTFATSLIEKSFKKKSLAYYSLPSVDDFAYLVDDLQPVVIVLDAETFDKNPEAFKNQYESSISMQKLPFILIENRGSLDFIVNKIGELKKPLEPFELPEKIAKILSAT